jgi:ABC-type lipoprotein release transport system permease subunit
VFAVLIGVLASLAPARRAASVQPMIAMRAE